MAKQKNPKTKISTLTIREANMLARFVGSPMYGFEELRLKKWNFIMEVIDKIESITGHAVDFNTNVIKIIWWYSPSKYTRFTKGFGGGGGHTEPRKPFDAIGGKLMNVYCYYGDIQFKLDKDSCLAKNKYQAVLIACARFVKWYNKTVKK